MSVLRIFLFGGMRIEHDGRSSPERATRGVQTLLAYLLLHRERSHSREVLAGLFWGDQPEDRARGCLSTTLWRLRRILEPDGVPRGTYLNSTAQGEIGFNRNSDHWLDVAVLEEGTNTILRQPPATTLEPDARRLESTLQLYTGDLLEGNYSDWALRARERLRARYLESCAWLMRYYQDHATPEKSLGWGDKILALDPLREEIHRAMMRLYLATGQRGPALRQYENCRRLLAAELGVEPMEETQAVYTQIVAAATDLEPPGSAGSGFPILQPALERLHEALRGVEQARQQCHRALQLVERLTKGLERKITQP